MTADVDLLRCAGRVEESYPFPVGGHRHARKRDELLDEDVLRAWARRGHDVGRRRWVVGHRERRPSTRHRVAGLLVRWLLPEGERLPGYERRGEAPVQLGGRALVGDGADVALQHQGGAGPRAREAQQPHASEWLVHQRGHFEPGRRPHRLGGERLRGALRPATAGVRVRGQLLAVADRPVQRHHHTGATARTLADKSRHPVLDGGRSTRGDRPQDGERSAGDERLRELRHRRERSITCTSSADNRLDLPSSCCRARTTSPGCSWTPGSRSNHSSGQVAMPPPMGSGSPSRKMSTFAPRNWPSRRTLWLHIERVSMILGGVNNVASTFLEKRAFLD